MSKLINNYENQEFVEKYKGSSIFKYQEDGKPPIYSFNISIDISILDENGEGIGICKKRIDELIKLIKYKEATLI